MRLLTRLILAMVPLLIVALGCNKLIIPGKVNLFEVDNAAKAAAAIKKKAGTDKVNVIHVEVRPNVMKVKIQSPSNPKDQDEYTYERGSATGPEPVKIHSVFADFIPQTTEISEINFAAIPETIKQAISVSKIENADVVLISMEPNLPKGGIMGETPLVFMWRIFVEGPRGQKSLWADKQGKLYE